jgi:hypothetical protein
MTARPARARASALSPVWDAPRGFATIPPMSDEIPLRQQLEEIGAQLDWVRDYL